MSAVCLRQDQVYTGYHGRRLTADVVGRIGPGDEFRAKYLTLPAGTLFAVTSTPNMNASLTPPMRPAINGWRYGYPLVKRKGVFTPGSGCWVPDSALGPDGKDVAWARGPAFFDFHVGRGKPRKKRRSTTPKKKSGRYVVRSKEAYLRYAPHSTSIGYLQKGDVVDAQASTGFYTCVKVVRSGSMPVGTVAWILSAAIRRQA